MWQVFSTVGYGDYVGISSTEQIFSMALELIGLTFFSLLMGLISGFFADLNEGFEEIFQRKMEYLVVWVNKVEKSKMDSFIKPKLYQEMIRYVEEAKLRVEPAFKIIKKIETEQECLNACDQADFNCLSIVYERNDEECRLYRDNRRTGIVSFKKSTTEIKAIYKEWECVGKRKYDNDLLFPRVRAVRSTTFQ